MPADPRLTIEAFSLSHAAILDGDTGAEETDGDIYGVNEGSLEPDQDSYDNVGDDQVMSTWSWLNKATVTIQSGYVPFKLIALLTGETVTSSGTDPNDWYYLELWTDRSMNVASKPMLLRMPSKDSEGDVRTLDIVLYKVSFSPMTFDGPRYREGLKINYAGTALLSAYDEVGEDLGDYKAVGRLISRPSI